MAYQKALIRSLAQLPDLVLPQPRTPIHCQSWLSRLIVEQSDPNVGLLWQKVHLPARRHLQVSCTGKLNWSGHLHRREQAGTQLRRYSSGYGAVLGGHLQDPRSAGQRDLQRHGLATRPSQRMGAVLVEPACQRPHTLGDLPSSRVRIASCEQPPSPGSGARYEVRIASPEHRRTAAIRGRLELQDLDLRLVTPRLSTSRSVLSCLQFSHHPSYSYAPNCVDCCSFRPFGLDRPGSEETPSAESSEEHPRSSLPFVLDW